MKKIIQKIFFVFAGVLISVLVLEIAMFAFNAVYQFKKYYSNRISSSRPEVYKILCLGESTTDGEYPWHLEEVLNARAGKKRFKVIDEGRNAATTDLIQGMLGCYLDKYKPDMVVTMMGINDSVEGLSVFHYPSGPWYRKLRSYKIFLMAWSGLIAGDEKKEVLNKKNVLLNGSSKYCADKMGWDTEEIYRNAIKLNSNDSNAYKELGKLLCVEKRYREAEEMYRKAIVINPSDGNAYLELGKLLNVEKRYREAEAMCRKAIKINSNDDNAYIELGKLLRAVKGYSEAETIFLKLLNNNHQNEAALRELLKTYEKEKKYMEMENLSLTAIESNPQLDWVYQTMGDLYMVSQKSKIGEAEALYLKVLASNPRSGGTYKQLSYVYRREKKYDKSDEKYKKYLQIILEDERAKTLLLSNDMHISVPVKIDYLKENDGIISEYYGPRTQHVYRQLKQIVLGKGIKLVCVQYPTCKVKPLIDILEPSDGIVFVDNEKSFTSAIARNGYDAYFVDNFSRDNHCFSQNFGHCTYQGNRLLAENIADAILLDLGR